MKYSLSDFKRAADRRMGGMELSPEGRDRLTRPARRQPGRLSLVGWAAAVAACLIMALLINLPALPGAQRLLSPGEATPEPTVNATASPTIGPAQTAAPALTPTDHSSRDPLAAQSARESAGLCLRADYKSVMYDYAGRPYYLHRASEFEYGTMNPQTDNSEDYYTEEEVMATQAGKDYYAQWPNAYFSMQLWPREERVTYLPDFGGNSSWLTYFPELDMGVLMRNIPTMPHTTMFALGSSEKLLTDFIFTEIAGFTTDGLSLASIHSEGSREYGDSVRQYGVIDSTGAWVRPPVLGWVETVYMDLFGEHSGSTLTYYFLYTYSEYEWLKDEDGNDHVRAVEGPQYLLDLNGRTLLEADRIGGLFSMGAMQDLPIPYKDSATGLYGYIDRDGRVVIKPQYHSADDFQGGLAAVSVNSDDPALDRMYGFIDLTGSMAIEPQFFMVLRGFDEESGTARVYTTYDGIERTINRSGADITSGVSIAMQQVAGFRDRLPLDATLSNWALIVLLAVLCMVTHVRRRPESDLAEHSGELGFMAMVGFALMYAAIDQNLHTALPSLLLRPYHYYDRMTYIAWGVVVVCALIGGVIYGWSMRKRYSGRAKRIAACAIMPLLPGGLRWALGACTQMDIDVAIALAAGGALGMLLAGDGSGAIGDARRRLIGLLVTIATIALILVYATWNWSGINALEGIDYSMSSLSEPDSMDAFRALLDEPEEGMQSQFGEDWRARLEGMLAQPEEHSVLTVRMRVRNVSPRANRHGLAWFSLRAPEPEDLITDYAGDGWWGEYQGEFRTDQYVRMRLGAYERGEAVFRFIVDTGDMTPQQWLDMLIAGERVNIYYTV